MAVVGSLAVAASANTQEVVDAIGAVATGFNGGMQDVPVEPVVIETAMIIE